MSRFKLFNSIHWKIITVYILLFLIAMQVIGAYFIQSLESHYVNNFTRMLDQQAGLFAYSIQDHFKDEVEDEEGESQDKESMNLLIERIFSTPNIEIQVLNHNGVVIGSSLDKQGIIGQKNTQIEVNRALSGTRDEAIRINPNNGHRMKILSLPIKVDDNVVGAIYLTASMEEMYQTVKEINNILATGTIMALALTAILGVTLAKTITSPIKEMTVQATAMADGEFNQKVKIYGQDEIGQLAYAFNDLSERLSQALLANEEERNKLASILFYMSDGVIATDADGRIILVNPMAENMLDLNEEDAIGKDWGTILPLPKNESFEDIRNDWRDRRYQVKASSGGHTESMLQVNLTALKREGDEKQGLIVVLQDVTQQEKLESERKNFVANVSHELRTPLTTMKSYLEALEDGVLKEPKLAPRFIHVTHQETDRMIRLVNDLLQLSKMDRQKLPVKVMRLQVESFLQRITERFSVAIKQRGITLRLSIDPALENIQADPDQLMQVFDNIISNAIKFTNDHGKVTLVAQKQKNDMVRFQIKDEGIGIPRSDLKNIFKRFYRVDKARSREMGGTGLGLAIAKEMIEAHQGEIWIESEVGKGTTVFLQLPIHQEKRRDFA